MGKREILRASAAGVQLTEVVHQMSQRVFSRYTVTTLRRASARDFVSMRTARAAFDEEVAACRQSGDGSVGLSPEQSRAGDRPNAGAPGAGGLDG